MVLSTHMAIFTGVTSLMFLLLAIVWSTRTFGNTIMKLMLWVFGIYGGLLFLEVTKFFPGLRIF